MKQVTHALRRTSPKGQKFFGTCALCGTPNLPMEAATWPCPNQRGLTAEEALVEVILEPDERKLQ